MKIHELKCLAPYFDAVEDGDKTFEVRLNDRGYQKGDRLSLRRTDDASFSSYSARRDGSYAPLLVDVLYVHPLGPIAPAHVVLAIRIVHEGPGMAYDPDATEVPLSEKQRME